MKILTKARDKFLIISVAGQIRKEDEPMFMVSVAKIINQGNKHIIIDFGNISSFSSKGIGCLAIIWKKLRDIQGDLQLIARQFPLRLALESTNVHKLIKIVGSDKDLPQAQDQA